MISQSRLKELLHYNPETGVFTWIAKTSPRGISYQGNHAGCLHNSGYWHIKIKNKIYAAHRLAWIYMTGDVPEYIDHINTVRNDNRFKNLRNATKIQNGSNLPLRITNTSGYKGVNFHKRSGKWHARTNSGKGGKRIFLGCFDNPQDANEAAIKGREKYLGEFARHS